MKNPFCRKRTPFITIQHKAGLSIYEFNMQTNEIMRVPATKVTVMEKCLYRQALNAKSCVYKLIKEGIISKEDNIKYLTR